MYLLGCCGPLQRALLWDWEFIPLLQPPQNFTGRGFDFLVCHAEILGFAVCIAPQLSPLAYLCTSVGAPDQPAPILPSWPAALSGIFSLLSISTPPASQDECFFISLIVKVPCSLIFWQFWLFTVFKFVVILLLVVQGIEAFLPMPISWLELLCSIL